MTLTATTLVQITVDLRAEKLCDGSLDWSAPWQAPEDAATVCHLNGWDAVQGYGKAYAVYVNGLLASTHNKDHRAIVQGDHAGRGPAHQVQVAVFEMGDPAACRVAQSFSRTHMDPFAERDQARRPARRGRAGRAELPCVLPR